MFNNNNIERLWDGFMHCFTCDKLTDNYEANKRTCASCREVLKIDLVQIIKEMDPIYLSESNRNKRGRKPKLTANEVYDIQCAYDNPPGSRKISMRDGTPKGAWS